MEELGLMFVPEAVQTRIAHLQGVYLNLWTIGKAGMAALFSLHFVAVELKCKNLGSRGEARGGL